MKKSVKIIISWTAVLICMAVIFILSAQKGDDSQQLSDNLIFVLGLGLNSEFVRACAHFLEYSGLAVLIYNALYQSCLRTRPFLSIIISAAYAVTDEIHQFFVEGRAAQISDIVIDTLGAAAGIAVVTSLIIICKNIKRRKQA